MPRTVRPVRSLCLKVFLKTIFTSFIKKVSYFSGHIFRGIKGQYFMMEPFKIIDLADV